MGRLFKSTFSPIDFVEIKCSLYAFMFINLIVHNGFGLGKGGDFYHPPRRIDAAN
jgi:hypothetical protein